MALEDVDYLKKRSIKKSYMFYIDSKDRDRNIFPKPNHYQIEFSAPFKNVYGLEIIDASIPRTQYAIDIHNNTLACKYISSKTYTILKIPVGDYSDKRLIIVLNNVFQENGLDIIVENLTIPSDERSTFVFYSTQKFIFDMNLSTLKTVLGFDLLADKHYEDDVFEDKYKYAIVTQNFPDNLSKDVPYLYEEHVETPTEYNDVTNDIKTTIETTSPEEVDTLNNLNQRKNELYNEMSDYLNKLYISYDDDSFLKTTSFTGPTASSLTFALNADENYTFNGTARGNMNAIGQRFYISEESALDSFTINFRDSRQLHIGFVFYQIGGVTSYTALDIKTTTNTTYFIKAAGVNKVTVNLSDTDFTRYGTHALLIFNPRDGDDLNDGYQAHTGSRYDNVNVCTNLKINNTLEEHMFVLYYDGTINDSKTDIANYSLCTNIVTKQKRYKIEAPGMYSLIGDRYTILRCPEIESHLFASHAYESYTLGLAKFKLGVLGYDESRFDFASLPPREFHPIGKLTKLTFSFQRPDGDGLYNFRGINHTMTIVIRYLTPVQNGTFDKFILNPEYDPDYFRYIQNDESDSDNEST